MMTDMMTDHEEPKQSNGIMFRVLSILVVLASLIVSMLAYPRLPAQVPMHWNLAGQIDRYSTPFMGAFMVPLLLTGMLILMWIVPKLDPQRSNYEKMGRVYNIFIFCILFVLFIVHLTVLGAALGYVNMVPQVISTSIGLLFVIMGNYFGKVKYNYTFGLRTPWTLANEQVWYRTHRAMGPLWMVGGITLAVAGYVPVNFILPIFIASLVILLPVPFVYSYLVFRRINSTQK